jgi:hypothetical protein
MPCSGVQDMDDPAGSRAIVHRHLIISGAPTRRKKADGKCCSALARRDESLHDSRNAGGRSIH